MIARRNGKTEQQNVRYPRGGDSPSRSFVASAKAFSSSICSVIFWLFLGAIFFPCAANATSYVYDANGRLLVVANDLGESSQFTYDAMGNIVRVGAVPPGELRLFTFTPLRGAVGTTVTLYGQGFSAKPFDNIVSFGGIGAIVKSAAANRLVVDVPKGASTAKIKVTSGSRNVVSENLFVVDDTGLPPIIHQVGPAIAGAGDSISITGSHLYPIAGKTTVQLDQMSAKLTSLANTYLSFVVPRNGSSGHVTVRTPYGHGESAETVLVAPSGIDVASIVSRGVAGIDNTHVNLSILKGGQIGAVLFDSRGHDWVSLQVSSITTNASNLNYKIYGPGNVLVQQGRVSATMPSIHLPRLTMSGMYLAIFQPDSAGAQLSVRVDSNVKLATDERVTLTTTIPGQSLRSTFVAQAGNTLAFEIVGSATTPQNSPVNYTIYKPDGVAYTSGVSGGAGIINLPNLPVAGAYQAIASPGVGVTGAMQVAIISGAVGTLPPDGTSQTYDAHASGQNVYLNFTAEAGDNLELVLANASVPGSSNSNYALYVHNATGGQVAYTGCASTSPGGNCHLHLWYMTAGQYTVTVVPNYGGTLHFDVILRPNLSGRSLAENTTVGLTLGLAQAERLTFDAKAGDTVALQVSGITTTPAGQPIQFLVYRPDTGAITVHTPKYAEFAPPVGQLVNLPNLPVSGRYTVIATPYYGLPANAQLSLVTGVTGTIPADGTSQTYDAHAFGQNVYLNFTAEAGENLELVLANTSVPGSSNSNYALYVHNAAGGQVAYTGCATTSPAGNCHLHLWYMAAGAYTVTVVPNYGGTLHFDAILRPNLSGRSLAENTTVDLTLGSAQAERLTFDGKAGDTVALQVTGVTTTPAGQPIQFLVYRPDTGAITVHTPKYAEFAPAGGQLVNLPDLPVSGTYTVIATPYYGLPANAQLSLVTGVTGTIPADGTAQTYDAHASGQNVYLDFTAKAGDNLELVLANASVPGSSNSNYALYVHNTAGGQVAYTGCATTSPAGNCHLHLWYMAAGAYTVTVVPNYGGTLHFDAILRPNLAGRSLAENTTVGLTLGLAQAERLTFDAKAGDTVALQVSGITTTPAGQPIQFLVYRPDTGAITVHTPKYAEFAPAGGQLVNLPDLPVSGTYTVIATPYYGLPANAQLSLVTGVTGTIPADGTAQTYDAHASGQNVYLDFTAKAGDNLELVLANASVLGSSNSNYALYVYNAAGGQVAYSGCASSSPGGNCHLHLWHMTAGQYTVTVVPNYGGMLHFDVILRPNLAGRSLAENTTVDLKLGSAEAERLTFDAQAGDAVALRVSGVTTTPAGQPIQFLVYRPDTGAITVHTPKYAEFAPAGGQLVNLPNLPVSGRYIVIATPWYGLPASAQISLMTQALNQTLANKTTALNRPKCPMESHRKSSVSAPHVLPVLTQPLCAPP